MQLHYNMVKNNIYDEKLEIRMSSIIGNRKGDATISGSFLSLRNNYAAFFISNFIEMDGNNKTNNDSWHLIVGVRESNHIRLNVDGKLNTTDSNSESVDNFFDVIIGKHGYKDESYFDGSIDDINIYNRALSEAEIQALYHLGN